MPQQLHAGANKREWASGPYEIRCAVTSAETELLIYGDIGDSWDEESVTASAFVRQLDAIQSEYITVRINSFGGAVSDALAIYNALRRHPAAVTAAIDGVAISAASLIAMAGDTVEMAENALFMVHAPWTLAMGNSRDMREQADVLDTFSAAMAGTYVRKTGLTTDAVMALLTDGEDHWYTAADAKADGFVDAITGEQPDDIAARFDASRFAAHAPHQIAAALKPAPAAARQATTPATQPKGTAMPDPTQAATGGNDDNNVAEIQAAATQRAHEEMKQRNKQILDRLSPVMDRAGIRDLYNAAIADPDMSVEQVGEQALAKLGEAAEPLAGGGAGRVDVGEDQAEKFARGAAAAIAIRSGMAQDDSGNEFRGHTLYELARASLETHNVSTRGLGRMDIVGQAFTHTTDDFGSLLANVASKSMLAGWDEAEETFPQWTRAGTLTDFKAAQRVGLNAFNSLAEVPEGAEYTYGTIGDRGEPIQLATYGKMFSITRQAVINDDLDAFTRVPRRMGRAAIRTIGNLVYAILTSNPNMSDGKALFHADHNNLLTAAGLTTDSVDKMRVAMRLQSDPEGNVSALNIPLRYLLVPAALGGTARTVMASEFEVGAGNNTTTPNSVRNIATVIEDARLDADSSSHWYGAADPNAFDTIEVAYLDGQQAPYLEQQDGWTVDGVAMKVRIDAGVKALDFRTLAKNPK